MLLLFQSVSILSFTQSVALSYAHPWTFSPLHSANELIYMDYLHCFPCLLAD